MPIRTLNVTLSLSKCSCKRTSFSHLKRSSTGSDWQLFSILDFHKALLWLFRWHSIEKYNIAQKPIRTPNVTLSLSKCSHKKPLFHILKRSSTGSDWQLFSILVFCEVLLWLFRWHSNEKYYIAQKPIRTLNVTWACRSALLKEPLFDI